MIEQIETLLGDVRAYAARARIKPETVFRKATNNGRLVERLERRAEEIAEIEAKTRAYMATNPVHDAPGQDAVK